MRWRALRVAMRCVVAMRLLAACEGEPIEKLEAPPPAPSLDPPPRPPPPPPPPAAPKAIESPAPVPDRIAEFLRTHANDADPWRVTLYSLGEDDGPFLGGNVLRQQRVKDAIAAEVVAWLGDDKTYATEIGTRGCSWVTPELGIEIARGSASLRMRYSCGFLFFDKDHQVKAMVSGGDAIVRFIEERSGFKR